jgi:hypothetical protein
MAIGPDVVDVLLDDHREVEGFLQELVAGAPVTDEEADRLLQIAIAELARHLVVEEEYLYPLVDQTLPDGHELAADGLANSHEALLLMKQLEGVPTSGPDRQTLSADLLHVVRRHIHETETVLFPELRRSLTPEQLGHLAGVVEMAKATAPTHAHPGAPHGTPWNQILTPGVGLVDKVRDAVTGRPTRPDQI